MIGFSLFFSKTFEFLAFCMQLKDFHEIQENDLANLLNSIHIFRINTLDVTIEEKKIPHEDVKEKFNNKIKAMWNGYFLPFMTRHKASNAEDFKKAVDDFAKLHRWDM